MRWKLKKKNWSKATWVAKKKKEAGLQIKTMKETKYLEIGAEKKHFAGETFLRSKNLISVAKNLLSQQKKLFCVTKFY